MSTIFSGHRTLCCLTELLIGTPILMLLRSLSYFTSIILLAVGGNMYHRVSTEKIILVKSFWLDFSLISATVINQPFSQLNHPSSQPKLAPRPTDLQWLLPIHLTLHRHVMGTRCFIGRGHERIAEDN
ncbi:unnamed protein product [Brassica rapa]|uniref:Uncharacterized protein n=1 Tax=Brassica campestris TaxID=3711 RepID=A0A8D9H0B8_BRACM|nr:unnamed protein product [Brassica rapa]